MRRALALLVFLVPCLFAHADDTPIISGYVTRVGAPTDFDVDGYHVVVVAGTVLRSGPPTELHSTAAIAPFLGQRADLWGEIDFKAHAIQPTRLALFDPLPAKVSGSAIIDLIPPAQPGDPYRLRADGRMLDLPESVLQHSTVKLPKPATKTSAPAAPAPATAQNLHTNVWIDYAGERLANGTIVLNEATFTDNAISPMEAAILKETEYNPTAVSQDAYQSDGKRRLLGIDPRQIPPYLDKPIQDRIDRIGASLIPAYQRALPPSDPTRIHFRFQLVNEPKWHGAYALPSGIILVPWHIAHRLTDDSELAAVLADSVAVVLEKEAYRAVGPNRDLTFAQWAGIAALFISPVVGIPAVVTGAIAGGHVGGSLLSEAEQQCDRVSLTLLHDAGYDIAKAPEAWWTLAGKEGKDPHRNSPPERARILYAELGTLWQPADRHSIGLQAVASGH